MEVLTFKAPEKLVQEISEAAIKAGFDSRSNFIRLLLNRSIKEIDKVGFHKFMELNKRD